MIVSRFNKIRGKANHDLGKNSLIEIIHRYVRHLNVLITCVQNFRMDLITGWPEYHTLYYC